jgi:diguanylate cyclase (GGDEF)-like protein
MQPSDFTIVVVDDEPSLRALLEELLGDAGYRVQTAASGEAALEIVRGGDVHVVLTDIRMGGMNGIDLIRHVRATCPDTEVVVMTSHASVQTAIEALRLGAYDYLVKPFEDLEAVGTMIRRTIDKVALKLENRMLLESLRKKNDELEELNKAIRELAIRDGLTGLYNYRYLEEMLQNELARAARHRRAFCVVMIDVDHFKDYNDQNGHLRGDEVLRGIGQILAQRARRTDMAARYGGEEFMLVLPETERPAALKVAEDLRRLIEQQPFPGRERQPLGRVTISVGVAEFPSDGAAARELIERADAALYRAKAAGRNRVCSRGDSLAPTQTEGA